LSTTLVGYRFREALASSRWVQYSPRKRPSPFRAARWPRRPSDTRNDSEDAIRPGAGPSSAVIVATHVGGSRAAPSW